MANLQAADLKEISLSNAGLREADFRLADLTGADLEGTDLSLADLRGANLSRAVLIGASLANANLLPYGRDDPDQLNAPSLLDGFDPSDLLLLGSRRVLSNLRRWRESAALTPTRFREAKLQGADLSGAFGYRADLRGADLTDADLRAAKVTEEQLAACASLEGAAMPDGTKHP